MFKKTFKLVKNKCKMFHLQTSIRNFNWRNFIVAFGLAGFALLLIFGNFKSKSNYEKLEAAKKENSQVRSIQAFQSFDERSINCTFKNCIVTCSGEVKDVKNYLALKKTCSSIILRISDAIFPEDKLQSNWLQGSFYLNSIEISRSKLSGIQDGAFDQQTVAYAIELELNDVQLPNLTEKTFAGLKTIEKFTLVNKIETFSGESFLKPMMKTLKKLVIKHVTSVATDPGPWLRGESFPELMTIIFDGSNFGGCINAATFEHLKRVSLLTMNSCNITSISDGSFDFMMIQMEVLISLQNNQLKRLNGEYLSKIDSLRRLDIQYNPWDCTCELEHLVRVFKDYPEGFGLNSKCSTPRLLAGKFLNEINLNLCKNEPLIPSEKNTSTLKPTTVSTPSASSTAFLTTTKMQNTYTNTSPEDRTTTLSADSVFIECATHKVRFTNYPPKLLELSPADGHFKILSISKTSVRMMIEGPSDDLAVIWFYEQPSENYGNVRKVGEFNVECQSELETSLVIEGLVENQSYIFCLVKSGTRVISPFNCQSYFSTFGTVNDTIWLRKNDKPLVIGVFVVSIMVSIFVGLIGMFLLIRYYPCLLRCTKQIEIVNKNIGGDRRNIENSVEPSFGNSLFADRTTTRLRRFSTESGLSYMMANIYEELEYYRRLNTNNGLLFSNRVPGSPAPAPPLPKRISGILRQNANVLDNDGYTSVV